MGKISTIGLDIGTTAVRAVQVEHSGSPGLGPATILKAGEVALPHGAVRDAEVIDNGVVATAIKKLWRDAGLAGKDVIIGIGNQRVVVRNLDLPWMPMDQIRQSLAYQAGETLPMSVDEALLDFLPTAEGDGPDGRFVSGMFVAAVKDTVAANVLAVEAAGLLPRVVDLNAFALLRALIRGDAGQRTAAFIDVGARVTNVVIAERGVPRLVRTIAAGGQDATDAIARAAKLPDAEAEQFKRQVGLGVGSVPGMDDAVEACATATRNLVDAVTNTLSYYSSQHRGAGVEMLVLTGGGVHMPGLGQYLSSATRIPATLGDPFQGMTWGRSARRDQIAGRESSFALATGLASGVVA